MKSTRHMCAAVLQAHHVSHQFDQHQVLSAVSLQLQAGEVLAVMGPSGSGKSTLLHLLAGLDRPSSGEIYWGTQRTDTLGTQARSVLRARQIGLVFQHHYLLEDLSVLQNVMVPALIAGSPHGEQRARWLLEQVGLLERQDAYPQVLSGGERQRVALARALLVQPLMLLADEPTGSLDRANSEKVTDLMLQLARQQGAGVLLVTHDDRVASKVDRVLTLIDGVLQEATE